MTLIENSILFTIYNKKTERGKIVSVTIKDIAKLAGVSHSTVSRALNNSTVLNEDTKKRIIRIAKELNYIPNNSARSLVLSRSYNIGVFFSSIKSGTSPVFFHSIIQSISQEIQDRYNIIVNGIDAYTNNYSSINPKNFDGIIVVSQKQEDDEFIRELMEKKIPVVVLNREMDSLEVNNIISDELIGVYKGIKTLINNGHRNIAVIEGKWDFESTKKRRKGYLKAFKEDGINIKDDWIVSGDYSLESGYVAGKKILELQKKPSAIFAFNDDMALGAIKAIVEAGLKVPEDISILGFDGTLFLSYMTPSIATIKRPIEEMSINGIKILLDLIENKSDKINKLCFKTQLIKGNSILKID